MRTRDLARAALFAALIAICSWISIPTAVPSSSRPSPCFGPGVLGESWAPCRWRSTCCWARWACGVLPGSRAAWGPAGGHRRLPDRLSAHRPDGVGGGAVAGPLRPGVPGVLPAGAGSVLPVRLGVVRGGVCRRLRPCGAGPAVLGWCVFPFVLPDLAKLALAVALSRAAGRRPGPAHGVAPCRPGISRPLSHIHGVRLWKGGVGYAL